MKNSVIISILEECQRDLERDLENAKGIKETGEIYCRSLELKKIVDKLLNNMNGND